MSNIALQWTDTDRVAVPPVPLPGVGGMASLEAERRRRRPVEGTEQSPIMEARAMRLFPTVLWRAEIRPDACRRINEAIVAKLAALRRGTANPAAGRGWQSGHDLHKLDAFHELIESIAVTVRDVLDYLRIGEVAFEITGCWANMNAPGAAHGLHSHPNNFLSGVYYVRVPSGGDTINFHDPRSQDTAKRVFQLHWVDMETGEIVDLRLTRAKFLEHFVNRAPCLVAMEACSGSQHWARRLRELGHEVRLLAG